MILKNWQIQKKTQKTLFTNSLSALQEGLIQETLVVDNQKDMTHVAKAAALCHGIQKKETQLEECCQKITDLEDILKNQ